MIRITIYLMTRNVQLLIPFLLLGLASCDISDAGDKIQIYTSFFAMEDLARKVGGQYVAVQSIVPPGSEIHSYEPTTSDIVALNDADMFVYNGAGLEHFVEGLKEAIPETEIRYVEASLGIDLLADDYHGDPHTWLSPLNAKKEMENIMNALIEVDSAHQEYYQNRYQSFADKFNRLDEDYQTLLAPGVGKYLVTGHSAFGYLTNEYGLVALPIGGYDSEQEPTQQDIANVISIVQANGIRYIYAESMTPSAAVLTVIDETDAELAILYTLEGLTAEQMTTGEDYFSVMNTNLLAIAKGFSAL